MVVTPIGVSKSIRARMFKMVVPVVPIVMLCVKLWIVMMFKTMQIRYISKFQYILASKLLYLEL